MRSTIKATKDENRKDARKSDSPSSREKMLSYREWEMNNRMSPLLKAVTRVSDVYV